MIEIGKAPEQTFFAKGLIGKENMVLFLDKDAERICSFHFSSSRMYKYEIEKDKYWNEDWEYNAFGSPCIKNGKVYVMSPKHRALLVLDERGKFLERKHLVFDITKEIRDEMVKQDFPVMSIIEENEILTLREYLQYL